MARRSYYPSTYGGFADGFTQGFGLVQNQYNTEREMDLEERRLSEQAARDERAFRANQAAADRAYGLDLERLKEEREGRKADREEAAATRRFQQGITQQNTDIAEARAQTELLKQQGESDKAVLANKTAAKDEYQQIAAAAYQNVFSMIDSGEFTDEQILQQIQITDTPVQVGDQTSGNSMSLLKLMDPKFQETLAGLTAELSRQFETGEIDPSHPVMLEAFDEIFVSRRGGLVGKTIDDSFTNPMAQRYKGSVVENVSTNQIIADEDGNLRASVIVAVRDPETNQVNFYPADVTENRNPAAGQASTPIKDVFDGVASLSVLSQEINRIRPIAENALINSREGGRPQYNAEVAAKEAEMREAKLADVSGNVRTYFSGKSDQQMSEADIRSYAESFVLFGQGRDNTDYRVQLKRYIDEGRKPLEKLLARVKPLGDAQVVFTDAEMLRLIATTNDNGRPTADTTEELVRLLAGRGYVEGSSIRTRREVQEGRSPAGSPKLSNR